MNAFNDDLSTHMCGACEERKPFAEFYKDGSDKDGNTRYRRDCKDCYRASRLAARAMKRGNR